MHVLMYAYLMYVTTVLCVRTCQVGDVKFGNLMGKDAHGNKYYENKDYPYGEVGKGVAGTGFRSRGRREGKGWEACLMCVKKGGGGLYSEQRCFVTECAIVAGFEYIGPSVTGTSMPPSPGPLPTPVDNTINICRNSNYFAVCPAAAAATAAVLIVIIVMIVIVSDVSDGNSKGSMMAMMAIKKG